jgi:hypothetical protein
VHYGVKLKNSNNIILNCEKDFVSLMEGGRLRQSEAPEKENAC